MGSRKGTGTGTGMGGIRIEIHRNEDPPMPRVEATPLDGFLITA